MVQKLTNQKKKTRLRVIYTSVFVAALATALVTYINSSFLETVLPKQWIGLIFSLGYLVALFVMHMYGLWVTRYKNHVVMLTNFAMQIVCLLLMAANVFPMVTLLAFLVLVSCISVTVINYDVLLEVLTKDSETGRVRGKFWTSVNLAFVFAPSLMGIVASKFGFSLVYLISALLMIIPWLLIFFTYHHDGKNSFKKHKSLKKTVKRILLDRNLRGIYLIAMTLYFFYSWMIIYTPMYLIDRGFGWDKIGMIFTVMLIPFVLVEYPAGYLADKYFGETEMLTIGLAIMGLAVLGFMTTISFWGVMIALFCTRVGASLVEIMRDTYFYKIIKADDLDLIDTFRNTQQISYILGPLVASFLLMVGFGLVHVFLVLGLVLLASTIIPFTIEDTK